MISVYSNIPNIKPEFSFRDDLGLDSLGMIELAMEIEASLDLNISDEDMEKWTTIQDIIDYVKHG